MLARLFRTLTLRSPHLRKTMWRLAYDHMARSYPLDYWRFMNYGFAALDPETTPIVLEEKDEADRYCIQLYHQVASSVDLAGLHVLEVGCGRGGGASYIARYLKPAETVGLDFSKAAIAFCRKQHTATGLSFVEGDAEHMPFDDNHFDAIVNVESSHCYGHMSRFLSEVRRVLKPGGHFLFADLRGRDRVEALRHSLEASGLITLAESDITANVIHALDLDNNRKQRLIQQNFRGPLLKYFKDFAGIKGSGVYQRFWKGDNVYLKFVLKRV